LAPLDIRAATAALALMVAAAPAFAQTAGETPLRGDEATQGPLDTAPTPTPTATPKKKAAVAPLPALHPYPGAERLGMRGGPPAPAPSVVPAPNVAVTAPQPKKKPSPDDDPFAPTGVTIGELRVLPYLEQDVGWTSNAAQAPGGAASGLSQTEGGLAFQSLSARNDLRGTMKLGYTDYFSDHSSSAPYGSGQVSGRLDATQFLSLDAQGRFNFEAEGDNLIGVPGVGISALKQPMQADYGGTVGGADKLGRFTIGLHGSLDRWVYQNAPLSTGGTDDLSRNNYDDYGIAFRGAFEVSPSFSPYAEARFDTWRYDAGVDSNGYARNSNGVTARIGAALEFTRMFTGDLSVGYSARNFEDPRFSNVSSPVASVNLIWTPTELTTVTLKGQGVIEGATVPGASADLARTYSLDVAQKLLANLLVGADVSFESDNYFGVPQHDSTTTFGLRAEYALGRDFVLKAAASREVYVTSLPGGNWNANEFTIGLRIRR
jgi:hypothetical protein